MAARILNTRLRLLALSLVCLTATTRARGQGAPEPPCEDRAAAAAHFKRGIELHNDKKLEPALAEFRDSRTLCPSQNNTFNVALLLKDLDRPIEALEMLDVLEHDFPALTPENAASAKDLREKLNRIVGTAIFDGDYPGARIMVDGKDIGTMPQARPVRLRTGMCTAKIERDGYEPLETTFIVLPNQNVRVAVALAVAKDKKKGPPKPPLARHSIYVGLGFSFTPGLGGKITECNDDTCSAPPGIGSLLAGGYRYRITDDFGIGAKAGYLFLWQTRSREGIDLVVDQNKQFADVDDDLFMNALFLGPEASYGFDIGAGRLDLALALGVMGGPFVNVREAKNGRDTMSSAVSFDLVPPVENPAIVIGGFFLSLQGSWRTQWKLAPGWPVHVNLGLLGFAPGGLAQYDAAFTAKATSGQTATRPANFGERLVGSWSFVITPGIAVYHDL